MLLLVGVACSDDEGLTASDAPVPMVDAPSETQGPRIHAIFVTHAQPCAVGDPSEVTIEIVASDADTPADQLTYSGSTGECGAITGRVSVLTCPQAQQYLYVGRVSDPQGNAAALAFPIDPCTNTPDAGP